MKMTSYMCTCSTMTTTYAHSLTISQPNPSRGKNASIFNSKSRKRRFNDEHDNYFDEDANEICKRLKANGDVVCDPTTGGVCSSNGTCVSSCSFEGLKKCNCPDEDDHFCYLCCGDAKRACRPAHEHGIFQPNGEHWERTNCARCRKKGTDGLSCDDRDNQRVIILYVCALYKVRKNA